MVEMFTMLKIDPKEHTAVTIGGMTYLEDATVACAALQSCDTGSVYAVNIPAGNDDSDDE